MFKIETPILILGQILGQISKLKSPKKKNFFMYVEHIFVRFKVILYAEKLNLLRWNNMSVEKFLCAR